MALTGYANSAQRDNTEGSAEEETEVRNGEDGREATEIDGMAVG